MKKIVIAVDGYSACGKSSTAKEVASRLGYIYIDTGAMYRAVTLFFIQNYINLTNPKNVEKALDQIHISFKCNPATGTNETYLNGLNVEKEIRRMDVSMKVSEVSALAKVRKAMVEQQRKLGKNKAVVMDGRDIGSFVFPDAELKIFMTADFDVRAERRQRELLEKGEMITFDEVKKNLQHRDAIDTTRSESPLKKADDAYVIDTTKLTMEEQIDQIVRLAEKIIN
ncbi:(d)CMP kinase [Fulvivirgaceae bacterium BMA12]|uniref:Cytidylate kinase n=1 Tax=Agaribacillus aureus TaxID=3051825 RepID=A0ABT8L0K4_9BACT|nr:(d)CMP kinase [Fulvivirgaceae bacterium BMA12]